MSDWSNYKKIKTSGGDIFKPESDKPYKIRVIGEPWIYSSEYKGSLSTRFALTIYNQTDKCAQILMLSKTAFGSLFDLKEDPEWGDPSAYDVTMKKTGEDKETRYSFIPSPKTPLDKDKIAEVEAIVLDEVLSRLPSVQNAFPISQFNQEDVVPSKAKADVVVEDIGDEPINLDEIPY